jgi:hypothetical protein
VETSEFWIALEARPFDEWPDLVSQLGVGALSINGRTIGLRQVVVLDAPRFQAVLPHWEIRAFDGFPWPDSGIPPGRTINRFFAVIPSFATCLAVGTRIPTS